MPCAAAYLRAMHFKSALASLLLLSSPLAAADSTPASKVKASPAPAADGPTTTPAGPTTVPPADAPVVTEEGSKADQLAAAQKQLSILKLRHDDKHPAVLRQRAKVARLQQETRAETKKEGPRSPEQELAAAKAELEQLQKRYTDLHPQVQALKRRIAELEKRSK